MFSLISHSPEETSDLGFRLAALLEPGDFINLSGDLGSGKTVFVKGVAAGLRVDPAICITSPTYTLLNIYAGLVPLYHFDFYRLQGGREIMELGFEEYFSGDGICLVEWGERLEEEMPSEHLAIRFAYQSDSTRSLTFVPSGDRPMQIMRKLFSK